MSDFLARLAARALGTAVIVTPRPAAVFAPAGERAHPKPEPGNATVQATGSVRTPTEETPSPVTIPSQESAVGSRPMRAPAAVPLEMTSPAPAMASPAEAPTPPAPLRPRRDVEEMDLDGSPLQLPALRAAATPAPPHNAGALTAAPRVDLQVPTGIMAARTWDDGMAGRVAASRRDPPPTAPTVHISIGRVEVRANQVTTDVPRTPRKTGAAQQLSLADYLRRGGGDRR